MQHETVIRVRNEPLLARLADDGLDGFPRVIPIGYHGNGAQFVVYTAATAPKVRALATRSQVALTIDTDTQRAHVLLVSACVHSVFGFTATVQALG
jgi:hypothetical protein